MRTNRTLRVIVTLLYILFIFSNSMQNADTSSRESGAVLAFLIKAVGNLPLIRGLLTEYLIRKSAHFLEYSLLGILYAWVLAPERRDGYRTGGRRRPENLLTDRLLPAAFLTLLIPFLDESIQLFSSGRSGQISDVWLDMSGILFGGGLALLAAFLKKILFPVR